MVVTIDISAQSERALKYVLIGILALVPSAIACITGTLGQPFANIAAGLLEIIGAILLLTGSWQSIYTRELIANLERVEPIDKTNTEIVLKISKGNQDKMLEHIGCERWLYVWGTSLLVGGFILATCNTLAK